MMRLICTAFQKPDSTTKTRGGRHSIEGMPGQPGKSSSVMKSQQPVKKLQRRSGEPKAGTSGTKEPEMTKRTTRKSGENQSESLTNKVPDGKTSTGGHSPRKKRLRSVDKIEQQLLAKESEKPSSAKKLKSSSNKKSDKSHSVPSVIDSLKRQKAQKGLKQKEVTEIAITVADKKTAQKKSAQTMKQLSVKTDKSDQGSASDKSTPKSLYDFTADSPKSLDSDSMDDHSEKQAKSIPKSAKVGATKRQKPADRKTRLRNRVDPTLITPKTKRCRVVLSPVDQNRGATKKIKVKVDIHSQDEESEKSGDQKNVKDKGKEKKDIPKKLKKGKTKTRSHVKDPKVNPIPKMPSISFLDNEITSEPYEGDSAIFMSPKPVMPLRVKKMKEKGTPIISGNIKDKRLRSMDCSFNVENIQSTSTPNPEPNPDSEPIRDKVQEFGEPKLIPPVFSPVKQLDTPATSDYGSMIDTPSTDTDYREREHSPSPAFSLEDDRGMD